MANPQKYLIEPVQQKVTDNIEQLLAVLPPEVCRSLKKHNDLQDLLEIVMDLGRFPEARFPNEVYTILDRHINQEDLDFSPAGSGAPCSVR
jgi:stage III sporulation protein SpoIIIAA